MQGLDDFYFAVNNTYEYATGLKNKGKNIIGYFCSYAPEEIIYAAGLHPIRLTGSSPNSAAAGLADAHLQSYCCSAVRGALEEALSGRLDFLDGAVFPHTCDSIQRLSDIWRLNTHFKFFADIVLPVKLNTQSAKEYMINILQKFKKDIEGSFNVVIDHNKLEDAVKKFNTIRSNLKMIYEIHSHDFKLISGRDLYTVMKAAMIMDRDYLLERLPVIIEDLKHGKLAVADAGDKKKIILTGSVCNQPDVYDVIEQSGGVVVWDDLCTGSRYFEGMAAETGDAIEAIAQRYAERPVCPAKHLSLHSRGELIVKMAKEHGAGVVFLLLKFCDPHAFDYPYIKDMLAKENIPNMLIEIEDKISEGQLSTRLETFMQML